MTTTTVNPNRPPAPAPRPNLPKGYRWSNVWRGPDNTLTEGDRELPVDDQWRLSGQLWVCPVTGCDSERWTFDDTTDDTAPCCTTHPARLVSTSLNPAETNPVKGAQGRVAAWVSGVYQRRKDQVLSAANTRLEAAQQAIADAARTTAADMRGHLPSIGVSTAVLGAGTWAVLAEPWWMTAVAGGGATCGAVVAYLVAYWVRRIRKDARRDAKKARRDRQFAQHVAAGTLAAGLWLLASTAAGVLPLFGQAVFTLLFGLLLMFAVNQAHWNELWAARHRLKDMLRRKAEAEARRAAEEAARIAERPAEHPAAAAVVDESDPAVVGQRMADEWARLAGLPTTGTAFPQMPRTWINPAETRELTAPDENGDMVRIGWEYAGHAQPGALVARQGLLSPILAAKDWLAATLFDGRYDPSKISIVDRPGGLANRFVVMVADKFPLGDAVAYKGRAGIRRTADGSLFGHIGRTLLGDDAERMLWTPGQAGGGGRYGVTGSGKSVVTQLCLLNDLYAGILPILWDGKNLMDFAEFIGVIPCGCTKEHRDVMYRSIRAEMQRRQQMLTMMEGVDRHGRPAPIEALWVPGRDGPPQRWTIEEFHMNARDTDFITLLTELLRLQRSSATMLEISTQGGGLADTGDSVLRDNLNQVSMQIMRMGDQQARLTGYNGDYMPSQLPRLPGMMLLSEADAPPVPVRAAFVHKRDEDGNIYDHLFDRENKPILTAPALPPETLEVYEREGLMDLWRLGQGPGGKKRLLNSGPVSPSTVSPQQLGPFAGQPLPAADVVLAIAWHRPGLGPTEIFNDQLWLRPAAGGKAPKALSTVTRAGQALEKAGKLTRGEAGHRVTEKGAAEAQRIHGLLVGVPGDPARAEQQAAEGVEQ